MKVSTLIWPYSKAQFMIEHLLLSLMSQFEILYYDFNMIHMIGNQAGLYYIIKRAHFQNDLKQIYLLDESTPTIEYSCPSVCLCVCVCLSVYTITKKIMLQST